ncbi:MAG: hypothetical protein IID59_00435 [Proteobacteria bacterium]|nr:hypothetical protein [Pseudomonadota bacterium]
MLDLKHLCSVIVLAILFGCSNAPQEIVETDHDWPRTVDEAVQILKSDWLSDEDIAWIRSNAKATVTAQLHLPFGTGVRNTFGLWGKNDELLRSCRTSHAEACSSVIFEVLWESIRSETDPKLAIALDCQFEILHDIRIETTRFYEMRIDDVLESVQTQIDDDVSRTNSACSRALLLVPIGEPDLNCWIRYEFEGTTSLSSFLNGFSWRNGFSVGHNPPNIELNFEDTCSWPEIPRHFHPNTG